MPYNLHNMDVLVKISSKLIFYSALVIVKVKISPSELLRIDISWVGFSWLFSTPRIVEKGVFKLNYRPFII